MAVNASKRAIMAVNCDEQTELTPQRQTISTTDKYTYLGYIMNPKLSVAGAIKNNKFKAQKAVYVGYYFLNRSEATRMVAKVGKNAAGQTVTSLASRKAKNNKSKIQHWAISRNIKNNGNWIGLTAMHPTLRLGLQDIGRMRMGSYWTAQRMANAKIIDQKYKKI
ncbi:hypothetical protein AYI69_g5580 [Smittium culicis]|uniref:Uncharacterized protein n=1 Tax=Smittium culicis TaxID=133412 RepID=A0A1R1Y5G8_9FUNG|nr:hypothetical protein AYI69_g5580 [Smittium culicis]